MNKRVLLFCSMLITFPAMAEENDHLLPPLPCLGVVESATDVMGKLYSIDSNLIAVDIQSVSKPENVTELTTRLLTTYQGHQCDMVWSTPTINTAIAFCAPELSSLSCNFASPHQKGLDELLRLRSIGKGAEDKHSLDPVRQAPNPQAKKG
jgi:hypothetical protein